MGIISYVQDNPLQSAFIAGGTALLAGGATYAISKKSNKKRKGTAKRKSKSKGVSRKSKRKSSRKIYTTRTGQPYIILASGKARFISKKSARTRRKRKGGYY